MLRMAFYTLIMATVWYWYARPAPTAVTTATAPPTLTAKGRHSLARSPSAHVAPVNETVHAVQDFDRDLEADMFQRLEDYLATVEPERSHKMMELYVQRRARYARAHARFEQQSKKLSEAYTDPLTLEVDDEKFEAAFSQRLDIQERFDRLHDNYTGDVQRIFGGHYDELKEITQEFQLNHASTNTDDTDRGFTL